MMRYMFGHEEYLSSQEGILSTISELSVKKI